MEGQQGAEWFVAGTGVFFLIWYYTDSTYIQSIHIKHICVYIYIVYTCDHLDVDDFFAGLVF